MCEIQYNPLNLLWRLPNIVVPGLNLACAYQQLWTWKAGVWHLNSEQLLSHGRGHEKSLQIQHTAPKGHVHKLPLDIVFLQVSLTY